MKPGADVISAVRTAWTRITLTALCCLPASGLAAPANDDCTNALAIGEGTVAGTLVGATNDGSTSCGGSALPDVWYACTADVDGVLVVDTCGTNDLGGEDQGIDTVLSVHPDCPGTDANEIACNDDASACGGLDEGAELDSLVSIPIMGGETVLIRVSRYEYADDGPFVLNVRLQPPLENDECYNATPIGNGTYFGTTVGATPDGESLCDCVPMSPDVWYVYEASCDGDLLLDTCGSTFDTVLSVYGECPGLPEVELACNDDCEDGPCVGTGESCIVVPVSAGLSYWIRVAPCGGPGEFELHVELLAPPPVNEDCVDAIPVGEGVLPFTNCGATTDGFPDPACDFSGDADVGSDVWFVYTAGCDGVAEVALCGSAFDTKLAAYEGVECPPILSPLACNDDACGLQSAVSFPVVAGADYMIRAGGYRGAQGEGVLEIQCLPLSEPRPVIVAIHEEPGDEVRIRFVEQGSGAAGYDLERSSLPGTGFAADVGAVITPAGGLLYDAVTLLGPDPRQFFRVKAYP